MEKFYVMKKNSKIIATYKCVILFILKWTSATSF